MISNAESCLRNLPSSFRTSLGSRLGPHRGESLPGASMAPLSMLHLDMSSALLYYLRRIFGALVPHYNTWHWASIRFNPRRLSSETAKRKASLILSSRTSLSGCQNIGALEFLLYFGRSMCL